MKMMLVCETDEEREFVSRIFDKMVKDAADGVSDADFLEGGVAYREDEVCGLIKETDNPIVYSLKGDAYTVYNFKTMKKTENVEGDLAGLANLPEEDFPTL